jgi:hypothetical protein
MDKKFTLLGPPTSFGQWSERETYFGPLHYYLISFPLWIFRMNPLAPLLFTGFLNLISTIVIFWIIRDVTKDQCLSLLIFSFCALSPILIFYSRFIWNPNFLPFFISLDILFFWLFIKHNQKAFLFVAGLFTGMSFQLHYITLPLLFAPILTICLFNRSNIREKITSSFVSLTGFLLGISPLLLFEFRHNFFITTSIFYQFLFSPTNTFPLRLGVAVIYLFTMIGRVFGVLEYSTNSMKDKNITLGLLPFIFSSFLLVFLLVRLKKVSQKMKMLVIFLSLDIIMGLLLAGIWSSQPNTRIEDRYFFPLIFPYFIVLVVAISRISPELVIKVWMKGAGLAILILAFFLILRRDWAIVNEKVGINEYQVNYRGVEQIAQIISQDVKANGLQRNYNIANIVDGNSRATYYRYFLYINQAPPLGIEDYPSAKVLYVISKKDSRATINYPVWEISSSPAKRLLGEWNGPDGTIIYKLGFDNR